MNKSGYCFRLANSHIQNLFWREGYPIASSKSEVPSVQVCHIVSIKPRVKLGKLRKNRWQQYNTSSINGDSFESWFDDDEWGIRVPLPNWETKRFVGAEPLRVSLGSAKFCWLGEDFISVTFELSSSTRQVNSSILSFNVDICSDSWSIAPYAREQVSDHARICTSAFRGVKISRQKKVLNWRASYNSMQK